MIEETNKPFNLWAVMLILARRKVFIISFVLICTVTAVVIALLLPKWYRAKTSILPSQHDQLVGLSGNFAQFTIAASGFELPIMATPSDVYATMLKSETVVRAVIDRDELQTVYDLPTFQQCYYYLLDMTTVKVTPEGIVELYYEDKNPELAATVANRYIEELDKLNRRVRAAKATSDREFVQHRLDSTKALLANARADLLAFQKDHKAIDLISQREMAITAAAELKTQLALTQVELDIKKKTYSTDHPAVQRLQDRVDEFKRQLGFIETGSGDDSYLDLPLADIPQLSLMYAEFRGRVEMQEKVFALLTEMYEEARIKEQKDTPTISVLETAYPPQLKYKPKRSLIVAAAFIGSLLLAIFLSLFADYLENLRRTSPTDFDLLKRARNEISGKTGYSDS